MIFPLIIKLAELTIPPLMQLVINHYAKKDTPEAQAKAQAHRDALSTIRGGTSSPSASSSLPPQ